MEKSRLKGVDVYAHKRNPGIDKLFCRTASTCRIYLFGSFADSTYSENSDFDFYIVVHDAVSDIPAETTKAYKSIRKVKQRPVDIVVGTVSHFEARKEIPSIENEVYRKGVLLYDTVILGVSAGSSNMAKHALDIWESPVPYDGLGLADIR